MRKNLNKIVAFAVCISICSSLTVFARPDEVIGHKSVKKWDYHKTNFDKNGNVRYIPGNVQFDTENEGKEVIDPRIPELISNDTLYGTNINISFNASTSEAKQWQANICGITKVDTESGNPNLEMDIKFKVEDGKIILYSDSRAIDYNEKHTIKIYSTGYEAIKHTIHVVKKAAVIRINPDFKPITNQDILFELVNFNYRITNPIYEVILDGKILKGDCVDYHVVSNLVRLERNGRISKPGKHTLVIKAYGYEDATLEFMVREGNSEANPVDKHVNNLENVNKEKFQMRMKSNTSARKVDGVSSASVSGGSGTVDGVSSASASGSLDMNANFIFDFNLISNAYILKNLGMETGNSKKVLEVWESTAKDAAISKETGRTVSWEAFTNEVEKAKVKGGHVTFEDYIKNPDAEDYKNRPYNVKYVLEDGLYGQVQPYNQINLQGAPELKVKSSNKLNEDISITFNTESLWKDRINTIKVGNTILRESEYKIEAGKITIKGYKFTAGENNVVIFSDGYKNTETSVIVERETIALSVVGEPNIGENVEIKGATSEYIQRLESITLNGQALLSEASAGNSGQYKVQMDKIILDKKLFNNTTKQTLIVKAYGYSDKMVQFAMKNGQVVIVDSTKDVVPTLKVKETIQGENVVITFDNDNPKWRNAIRNIYVANRPISIDKSSYSTEKGEITILAKCFSIGENKIGIEAEGYDDVSIMQSIKEKPVVEFEKAFPKFEQVNKAQVGKDLVFKVIKENNKDYANWNNNITVKVNDKVLKTSEYEINKDEMIIKSSIFTKEGLNIVEIIAQNFEKVTLKFEVEKADLKQAPIIKPEPIFSTSDFIIQGSEWTNAISKIVVVSSKGESKELVSERDYYYDKSNARVIIDGSVFAKADLVDIVISANGYVDSTIKLTVKSRMAVPAEVRLAEDKTISTGQAVKINLPSGHLGLGEEYEVKEVYVNGKKLSETEVEINSLAVTISKDCFNKLGKYIITLKAPKYEEAIFEITAEGSDLTNPGVLLNSPALIPDTTDTVLGSDIEVTFVENQAWRNGIEKININGTAIELSKVKKESGKITFYSSLLSKTGTYSIEILSNGFKPVTIEQIIREQQPVITTNLTNKTVNENKLNFTAKANKPGSFENEEIIVKLNGKELQPKEGTIQYEAVLNLGDNSITIEVKNDTSVAQTFTVTCKEAENGKVAPVFKNITEEAGKNVNLPVSDSEWLNAIKSIEVDGVVLKNSQRYSIDKYLSKSIVLYKESFNMGIKEYNVVIKAEGYADCSLKINVTAKQVPTSVKVVNNNVKLGEDVKIAVKEGFMSEYHKYISKVIVDNQVLDNSKYTLPGEYSFGETELKIKGAVFTEAKEYTITLKTNGYEDKILTVKIGK